MNTLTKEPQQEQRAQTLTKEPASRQYLTPDVNIFETKDSYVLQAEMPGVNKQGLEVTLEGHELTILGRRHQPEAGLEVLYRESTAADYRRVFEIDPAIDTAKIDAKVDQGVLTLVLPKSEQVRPRKVVVE